MKKISIRIAKSDHARISAAAQAAGKTFSQHVRDTLMLIHARPRRVSGTTILRHMYSTMELLLVIMEKHGIPNSEGKKMYTKFFEEAEKKIPD